MKFKTLQRILLIISLGIVIALCGFTASALADEPIQYLEDGFEEISPNGCVYYSSARNSVYSKDGLYHLSGDRCQNFTSRWTWWVHKYQTALGKWRASKVKELLQ